MERYVLLCIIIVQVLSKHYTLQQNITDGEEEENDKRSWEVTESTEANRNADGNDTDGTTKSTKTTLEELNPCSLIELPAHSSAIRTPGQRISEIKCFEYIYEIRRNEFQEARNQECQNYLSLKDSKDELHFSVVGGRDAYLGEFPHMAAIGWKASIGTWVFKCGGSLISSKFVLSAAHCSKASSRDTTIYDVVPKIVRLGYRNIIDVVANGVSPADTNIVRIIDHPNYKAPKKYFDIALIELEKDVVFTEFVHPACIYVGHDDVLVGKKASLAGWGVVETVDKTTSPVLQTAIVDVLDSQTCDKLLRPSCNRHWCGMNESQLCAGKLSGGVDACQGDSGGPLQIEKPVTGVKSKFYSVIGVTSFGIGCALPQLPGIYTRVSSFVDWIEDIVWK